MIVARAVRGDVTRSTWRTRAATLARDSYGGIGMPIAAYKQYKVDVYMYILDR